MLHQGPGIYRVPVPGYKKFLIPREVGHGRNILLMQQLLPYRKSFVEAKLTADQRQFVDI